MNNHDITAPIITPEERLLRRTMGWILRGRHVYTLRAELYARGWVWDSGAGGMLAPCQEEWEEWAPPPVLDGDTIIKSGGRYCQWPIRAVETKYLLWLISSQMATHKERQAARAEIAARKKPKTNDESYRESVENTRRSEEMVRRDKTERRAVWFRDLPVERQREYQRRYPTRTAEEIVSLAYDEYRREGRA